MDLLPLHDFVISCTENIGYIKLCGSSRYWHILLHNIKNQICEYHHWSHQKSFKYWEAVKLMVADTSFHYSNFYLKPVILLLETVFIELTGTLIYFLKYLLNIQDWIIIVYHSFK